MDVFGTKIGKVLWQKQYCVCEGKNGIYIDAFAFFWYACFSISVDSMDTSGKVDKKMDFRARLSQVFRRVLEVRQEKLTTTGAKRRFLALYSSRVHAV